MPLYSGSAIERNFKLLTDLRALAPGSGGANERKHFSACVCLPGWVHLGKKNKVLDLKPSSRLTCVWPCRFEECRG